MTTTYQPKPAAAYKGLPTGVWRTKLGKHIYITKAGRVVTGYASLNAAHQDTKLGSQATLGKEGATAPTKQQEPSLLEHVKGFSLSANGLLAKGHSYDQYQQAQKTLEAQLPKTPKHYSSAEKVDFQNAGKFYVYHLLNGEQARAEGNGNSKYVKEYKEKADKALSDLREVVKTAAEKRAATPYLDATGTANLLNGTKGIAKPHPELKTPAPVYEGYQQRLRLEIPGYEKPEPFAPDSLSVPERRTLKELKTSEYRGINQVLRGDPVTVHLDGKTPAEFETAARTKAKLANSAIDKLPGIPDPIVVQRGVRLTAQQLDELPVGTEFAHAGFYHATYGQVPKFIKETHPFYPDQAPVSTFRVRLPKGTKAAPLDLVDGANEQELMLKAGSRFKVTKHKRSGGKSVIDLEYLGD